MRCARALGLAALLVLATGHMALAKEDTVHLPCVCCGYLTMTEGLGSFDICPICFWEDDMVQAKDPYYAGGANRESLIEAQANYERVGACSPDMVRHVRKPRAGERREPGWRRFDPKIDDPDGAFARAVSSMSDPYYWAHVGGDSELFYWWRPTFWWKHREAYAPRHPRAVAAIGSYVAASTPTGESAKESAVLDHHFACMRKAWHWNDDVQKPGGLQRVTGEVRQECARLRATPLAGPYGQRAEQSCRTLLKFLEGYKE